MRAISALVATLALSLGVAAADPNVVIVAASQGSTAQPLFDGMVPVAIQGKGPVPANMTAAKVIGEYSSIPVAPATFTNRPTIINADGSVYGQPKPVVVAAPGLPPVVALAQPPAPVEKPVVFTSPPTNVPTNLPAPLPQLPGTALPPPAYPPAFPFGGMVPRRSERRIAKQIGKLVKMIIIADTQQNYAQVVLLNKTLRRITKNVSKFSSLAPIANNALLVVKPLVYKAKGSLPESVLKVKKAAKKLAKAKKAAEKAVKAIKKAEKKQVFNKTSAAAAVKKIEEVKKAVAAAAPATTKVETPKAAPKTESQSVSSSLEETVAKLSKRVEILSKAAISFKKQLGADKESISGLTSDVSKLQKGQSSLEAALKTVNRDIAAVTKKYNSLAKKEQSLTAAAKRALSTLSKKVATHGKVVKNVVRSRNQFKRSVMASLAQLEENLQNLQEMSH